MFSTKEFIEASRAFVCVRIETYENKENEEMIRSLLNGRYANTAFCMFDPQGTRRLSRTGRSPTQVIGRHGSDSNVVVIKEMEKIAARYKSNDAKDTDAILQDFLSFGQALNVASADQRLLVFVDADQAGIEKLKPNLQKLFADKDVIGRFHLDFKGDEDSEWSKAIKDSENEPGINFIQAGKFGLEGSVVKRLSLDSSLTELKDNLLAENKTFSSTEERKDYGKHVMEGNRKGIKYESEIPYGEDRDGDGKIDVRGKKGGRR